MAREALESALKEYDGTILFVSHDRRFIEAIAGKIALIENGELTVFQGDYSAFLQDRKERAKPPVSKAKEEKQPSVGYRSKEERAKEARKKARIKEIETTLEALEEQENALNEALAEYARDYLKVQEITQKLQDIHAQSNALYEEYETLI